MKFATPQAVSVTSRASGWWHAGWVVGYENLPALPLPDDRSLQSLGVVLGEELHGGYQSRVFAAERQGDRVAVKLTDTRHVDGAFHRRVEVSSLLAEIDDMVVAPMLINAGLVVELDGWLVTVYPFIDGRTPDIDDESDVRQMATSLAILHRLLRQLASVELPLVAALVGSEFGTGEGDFTRPQLLHGDFSDQNVLLSDGRVRVIDFADCGYGPIEFEVGNSLYMVLFDAVMSSGMERYGRFRSWFVDEYRSASGHAVPDEVIDEAIGLRVQALSGWLERPETAPVFVRTSTPEWRETLRGFVQSQTQP